MTRAAIPQLYHVGSVEEAVGELARLAPAGAPLAGATWIMRAPLRGEPLRPSYVALQGIAELAQVSAGNPVRIGALATHADIGALEEAAGPLGAVAEAARRSAFPAIRNVATIGGNVCARPFPEADLVPALLASEATLELASQEGRRNVDLRAYLDSRQQRPPDELIVAVLVPAPPRRRGWFERVTVRGGAEYSIVSVAVSLDVDGEGGIREARVAVGGVEEVARRVGGAEARLRGARLDTSLGEEAGRAAAAELTARDGLDAPGWYRLEVLPHLLGRALARIAAVGGAD